MVRLFALLFLAACAGPSGEQAGKGAGDDAPDGGETGLTDTGLTDTSEADGPETDPDAGSGETGDSDTGDSDTGASDTGAGSNDTGGAEDTGAGTDTGAGSDDPDTGGAPDTDEPGDTGGFGTPGPDTGGGSDGDSGSAELDPDPGGGTDPGGDRGADPGPAGRTYRFNLREGALTEPPGIGGIFTSYIEDHLLVEVLAADDATLSVRWGWSDGLVDRQDTCAPTSDAVADFAAAPWFETAPTDSALWAVEEMDAERATLSGAFSRDASTIEDATFSALAETSALAPLLGSRDPEAFCDLMTSFGEACEPCADGSLTCMRFTFEGLTGVDVSPLALVEVPRACR